MGRQWIYRARLKLITFRFRAVIHHNAFAWLRSSVFAAVFSHISSRLHPRVPSARVFFAFLSTASSTHVWVTKRFCCHTVWTNSWPSSEPFSILEQQMDILISARFSCIFVPK